MTGKKLLVADDSLTIQKVIRLALSNEGYEIQAVSDGNDAIEQISVFRPDVVLIDVSLPGKTAFEVKRAINEYQDLELVRFVLMSSAFEKVDEPQVKEVCFHGRLTKPFDPAHLRQVLKEVLEQVAAHRREPTSLLQRPAPESAFPANEPMGFDLPPAPEELAAPTAFPPVGEDWMSQPLTSEQPILTPPPAEPVGELWDQDSDLTQLPPPLPRPASPRNAAAATESTDDIKQLTESTIRMSGLNDFEWSVNEPSLKPSAALQDLGGTTFEIEPSTTVEGTSNIPAFSPGEEPSLTPLAAPAPEHSGAASPSEFYRDAELESPHSPEHPQPAYAPAGLSPTQMEELLRQELRKTLQQLAEKILPEVAEKVIKQEIHKMLSEG